MTRAGRLHWASYVHGSSALTDCVPLRQVEREREALCPHLSSRFATQTVRGKFHRLGEGSEQRGDAAPEQRKMDRRDDCRRQKRTRHRDLAARPQTA